MTVLNHTTLKIDSAVAKTLGYNQEGHGFETR
jgi:hypothetical protein